MTVILLAKIPAIDAAAADKIEKREFFLGGSVLMADLATIREVSLSEKEPGCTIYHPSRSNADKLQFMVYEEYADQAAVDGESSAALV